MGITVEPISDTTPWQGVPYVLPYYNPNNPGMIRPSSGPSRRRNGFSNQTGTPLAKQGMSVSQYVMGLVGVGVLFFVIGYGYKKGVEKA